MLDVPNWALLGNLPTAGEVSLDLHEAQRNVIKEPGNPTAWVKFGGAHYLMAGAGPDHYLEAHLAFERALNMAPTMPGACMGLASTSYTFGATELALQFARDAQKHARLPYREAQLAEGGVLLKLGQWQEGWTKHEARQDRPDWRTPRFTGHLSDLRGKTVFVRGEQGFGDNIQFSRYVWKLMTFCGDVIVEAPSGMERLMPLLVPSGTTVVPATDEMLGDIQISIMSLPHILGRMIGWEPIRPRMFSLGGNGSVTGICPVTTVGSPQSLRKNPPRHLFGDLGIEAVSLAFADMARCSQWDWLDTAHYLSENCNLVISVDTAVAHLAATMGIEVWLLQRADSCWRWDHPNWYSNVRVFQQSFPGDWEPVFDQIRQALAERKG